MTPSPARPATSGLFTPGPRFLATYLLALPPAVVALASTGITQQVSGIAAICWLALVPVGLYARWAVALLPVVALASLVATLAALPFNSGVFWANVCTTTAMFLVALPRRGVTTRGLVQLS